MAKTDYGSNAIGVESIFILHRPIGRPPVDCEGRIATDDDDTMSWTDMG